jgi:hypothetical protein
MKTKRRFKNKKNKKSLKRRIYFGKGKTFRDKTNPQLLRTIDKLLSGKLDNNPIGEEEMQRRERMINLIIRNFDIQPSWLQLIIMYIPIQILENIIRDDMSSDEIEKILQILILLLQGNGYQGSSIDNIINVIKNVPIEKIEHTINYDMKPQEIGQNILILENSINLKKNKIVKSENLTENSIENLNIKPHIIELNDEYRTQNSLLENENLTLKNQIKELQNDLQREVKKGQTLKRENLSSNFWRNKNDDELSIYLEQQRNEELEDKEELQKRYNELKIQYDELKRHYDELESENINLINKLRDCEKKTNIENIIQRMREGTREDMRDMAITLNSTR